MQVNAAISSLEAKHPEIEKIIQKEPIVWFNTKQEQMVNQPDLALSYREMELAATFMDKYAPFICKIFPETKASKGHINSPLYDIENFKKNHPAIKGKLLLKGDNLLAVAGSIKARGGFFEVLQFAHHLAVKHQLIKEEETADFTLPAFRDVLSQYTIGVGSTGNLGLSIGIISAKLGFKAKVYMSQDAKQWKKDLLHKNGATVIEEDGDFGVAITKGREATKSDSKAYFVDDEKSKNLFLGYSLAAFELKQQLQSLGISIDKNHPLFVYQPCGVGGSPGGVMWGLKNVFGDCIHSFFVEPTHSPAVLLGLITEKFEKICVQDFGLDNLTEADGLAVGRPSAFASSFISKLVSGIYTIEDKELIPLVKELNKQCHIFVEPSATAGLIGPERILASAYCKQHQIDSKNITHIVWATGGGLVPENIKNDLLK